MLQLPAIHSLAGLLFDWASFLLEQVGPRFSVVRNSSAVLSIPMAHCDSFQLWAKYILFALPCLLG